MIDRRTFLRLGALSVAGLATYSMVIEPGFFLDVTRYRLTPAGWPDGLRLRIAILTDLHACEPWMPFSRIRAIARAVNDLSPDLVTLLGDYSAGTQFVTAATPPQQWAEALSVLSPPLGVHAVFGNNDWAHGPLIGQAPDGAEAARRALRQMGAHVYENDARRITKDGAAFWMLGLGDQFPALTAGNEWRGLDDLDATLAQVDDDAPAILLAHEPFIFPRVPNRITLTLSGHTHGGQVDLPLVGPLAASLRWPKEWIYGHHVDAGRHLIVSAGLGESFLPVRFRRPPEIVEVILEAPAQIARADL
jgi:predicted MPP superfamily phosphohydrolase